MNSGGEKTQDEIKEKPARRTWLPAALVLTAFAGLMAGSVYWLRDLLDSPAPPPKQVVHNITLLKPPPPPPKIDEPPPQKLEEAVELPEPEPIDELPELADQEPSPSDQLGLDAEGGAGSDGFGLAARKGSRGLLSGGDPKLAYAAQLQQLILNNLNARESLRRDPYTVIVRLWLDAAGHITRSELADGSGNTALDREIVAVLNELPGVGQAPPAAMPQPVRLRIRSQI